MLPKFFHFKCAAQDFILHVSRTLLFELPQRGGKTRYEWGPVEDGYISTSHLIFMLDQPGLPGL
jgi:hypothetical protein